eukprot:scaffold28171_cov157-Isochrysis_galbana.AAC.1
MPMPGRASAAGAGTALPRPLSPSCVFNGPPCPLGAWGLLRGSLGLWGAVKWSATGPQRHTDNNKTGHGSPVLSGCS